MGGGSPPPGPGSEPAGVSVGTRPRSLRFAHRPLRGQRGPTHLRSLVAELIPAGAGPFREAELGAPALHALRFSPYPVGSLAAIHLHRNAGMQESLKVGTRSTVSSSATIALAWNSGRTVPSGQLGLTDSVRKR